MTTRSTLTATADDAAVRAWLRTAAHPLTGTDAEHTDTDLEPLIERLAGATVIGLGESTRFSHQTYGVRERIFRILVEEHGFRALAIQDSARSGERLDAYARYGTGDPHAVLAGAWRPWRTAETVATLEWIRAYNERHPDDQVSVFGVEPPAAEPTDYDAVLDYVQDIAPDRLTELRGHLAPIRTAHRIDEHVQRHQGIHPGRPFVEHARDALALVESLSDPRAEAAVSGESLAHRHTTALDRVRLIVAFHENSVAGQGGFARDEKPSADTIVSWYDRIGARIVYWDGLAHTSALSARMGGSAPAIFRGTGSHLRAYFGPRYLSVAIGFHHGDLGMAVAPDPAPDLLDAALAAVDLPAFYLDLSVEAPAAVRRWLDEPVPVRVISGVYDPAQDDLARFQPDSLAGAFDALVHIRQTTPVRWLPEPHPA
ncbi:erythromycin esterase family protein [Nocardia brevicatena]|uniref:erythromycin esterase family protein n=1 Tax=Nocardia brevicatena TaxID=37327 RepID=UPI0002E39D7A|nr:erythromycin esterase family protein [Nocardia brevicatena]